MNCIIAGASGLIGTHLVKELEKNDLFDEIILLLRRPLHLNNPKFKKIIFDFESEKDYEKFRNIDIVFCCLGTTIKVAKNKDNFRKVDFEYPLKLAQIIKPKNFSLVTSMSANSNSLVFYSKVKGELEEALKKLTFGSLQIFRPSQLLGNRKEFRLGEQFSEKLMTVFQFIIPKNYRLIKAKTVAQAMNLKSCKNQTGVKIYLSNEIKEIVTNG